MTVEGRIVAGSDGSPHSMSAIRWAAGRAKAYGAGLTIVRVLRQEPIPTRTGALRVMLHGPDYVQQVEEAVHAQLKEAAGEIRASYPDLDVQTEVMQGDSAGTLADLTGTARMLVVGKTGASAVPGVLLGGTATGIVHHAHGPVAVIPGDAHAWEGPVVVGLDEARSAAHVARVAIDEAAATGSNLIALFAWDVDASLGVGVLGGLYIQDEELLKDCDAMLAELTASAQDKGVAVERKVIFGRAEQALAELSSDASLVVVGSRGRGGFAGLLLGSVSRSLMMHSACPVLVIRS